MAPSYANICMRKLEKQLLESSIERLLSWYRFIDDVDMKWTQSDEELQNFLYRTNNLHPSIKFTHEISNTTISFLNTSSSLSEGVLSTDLYSKPTDTNQYLLPRSCHPSHVTKSIPYRQGWYMRTQGVLLHFCFSLFWSKLLLEMLLALLKLFLIIVCL
jgi:hypothetical protein